MKLSFAIAATLAASALAAPAGGIPSLSSTRSLSIGNINKQLNLASLPKVSNKAALPNALAKSAAANPSGATGHIIQDLGPELENVLEITGPNLQGLLIELSPEVAALVSGLGLPQLGVPLGAIVASAGSLGELIADLGPPVNGIVTVVGRDVGCLLIELAPEVAALVSGLGLPSVGIPLGTVIATIGANLKRDDGTGQLLQDLAPIVGQILTVTGTDAKELLIQLSPEVAALFDGLGLTGIGAPVGAIIATAGDIGDLLKDLACPVEELLTVIGNDGSFLLVQLAPSVAALIAGLGLPGLGVAVGTVVATIGEHL